MKAVEEEEEKNQVEGENVTSNEELMKEDRLVNREQPREMDSMGGTAFTASL